MNRADFLKLFAYSDNCWRVLGETLAVVPDAWEIPFPTTSNRNTIRLLQAHCIGAEERWITLRLQNQPLPVVYEERAASDWAGLYQDHLTIRAATCTYLTYLDSLTDAEVKAEMPVLPANERIGGVFCIREWTRRLAPCRRSPGQRRFYQKTHLRRPDLP